MAFRSSQVCPVRRGHEHSIKGWQNSGLPRLPSSFVTSKVPTQLRNANKCESDNPDSQTEPMKGESQQIKKKHLSVARPCPRRRPIRYSGLITRLAKIGKQWMGAGSMNGPPFPFGARRVVRISVTPAFWCGIRWTRRRCCCLLSERQGRGDLARRGVVACRADDGRLSGIEFVTWRRFGRLDM
jgi:hypothetical protein